MLKTIFINTLKLIIAGGLIGWLIGSGKLDFQLFLQLRDYPLAVLISTFFILINYFLTSVRWRNILKARSTALFPILGMLKVTWIGQFFSSVLPGSVTGDFLKIIYIQDYDRNFSKKFIFASILIDRIMGLAGLILVVGFSSLFYYSHILENAPKMALLININFTLMALVIFSLVIFIFGHQWIRKTLLQFQRLGFASIWFKIIGLWDDLTAIRSRIVVSLLISILVQFLSVVIFWNLIAPFVGESMDFFQALAFIPLGLMSLALPLAPSGLGVGHTIFHELFKLSGIENGASLFNVYFVVTLSVNVLGVFPYLLNKKKIRK